MMHDAPTPEVRALDIPPGARRNPIVAATVVIGELTIVFGVSRLRKSGIIVRPPTDAMGRPGVVLPQPVALAVELAIAAAIVSNPAMAQHLRLHGAKPARARLTG